MCVNVAKTKYIIFRTRGKYINENIEPLMFNANEPGQPVDANLIYPLERIHDNHPEKNMSSYKLLGVFLDEYLSFNHQTNVLCNKLSKALYCINRVKNLLSKKHLDFYIFLYSIHILTTAQ